jgi:MFS family permease
MVFSLGIPVCMSLIHFGCVGPWAGMGLLGMMFAVTESNAVAMVAEVVPRARLGVAYGVYSCGVSIALVIEPTLVTPAPLLCDTNTVTMEHLNRYSVAPLALLCNTITVTLSHRWGG